MQSITVSVPATIANLGPGYDSMGVAVELYNRVSVSIAQRSEEPHPMAAQCYELFFREAVGVKPFTIDWAIEGEVPISRGLGSSVTLRQGILQGLNELADRPLSAEQLYRLCSEAEGHPDNAGPGVFGGFFVAGENGSYLNFSIDEVMRFVVLIPQSEVLTDPSRNALPEQISHGEAAKNTSNAALIAAAFASREYQKLGGVFRDYLHQSYRASYVPGLAGIIAAGEEAGAIGGFLCGSGSSIACFTEEDQAEEVGLAMQQAVPAELGESRVLSLAADNVGAQTLPREVPQS